MSLNSVVNKLVRAAASVPTDISDTDLDAHVASLLAAEAKANESKWAELGLGAYLRDSGSDSPDAAAPKPNKRFLASVIRTVDGHNQALLRQQAAAATDARGAHERASRGGSGSGSREGSVRVDRERREGSGSGSRRDARGTSGASRLFGGALAGLGGSRRSGSGSGTPAGHSSRKDGVRDRSERRSASPDDRERERERGSAKTRKDDDRDRKSRDRRRDEDDDRRKRYDSDDERDRRHRRDRSRSRSRSRSREREKDRRREKGKEPDRDRDRDRRDRGRDRDRSRSRSRSRDRRSKDDDRRRRRRRRDERRDERRDRKERRRSRSRSRSPKRAPPPPPDSPSPPPDCSPSARDRISRMDKYFHSDYDPRLDVGDVPRTGIVADVGWDNMLAVLKERGQKRRKNSPSLSASPEPQKRDRVTTRPVAPAPAMSAEMKTLMEMEYTQKGGVREWDKGK